jgi:FtsP/CotA-like multicopper oxidase with cupredoxin domain
MTITTASGAGPTGSASAITRSPWLRRFVVLSAVAIAATAAGLVPLSPANARADSAPADGLICTTGGSTPGQASFVLTAKDGNVLTPDGNSIYMWSYANGTGAFQYPGPNLCVNEGDNVTVTLKNTLPQATSIVFPGITNVLADGKASQPDLAANTLTKAAAAPATPGTLGGSVTYTFTAAHPGTYLYESGTNPQIQVQMGLVGALVVRPTAGANHIYDEETTPAGGTPIDTTVFKGEFIHLLSEIDPDLHLAIEQGASSFDMTKYKARYWMINGRSFPDTIAPNFAQHLPNQPYGALVHVVPRDAANPDPAVIRYLNAGPVSYPFHPHSNNERVVGIDARRQLDPTAGAGGTPADTSIDRFSVVVPPGATIEAEFSWSADPTTTQAWDPTTRPIDVPVPQDQSRTDGAYWNGTPYLGSSGPLINGLTQYNECGEFYHVAHSHALFQATNYGASMGGMLTMVRIDPPNSAASCTKAGN